MGGPVSHESSGDMSTYRVLSASGALLVGVLILTGCSLPGVTTRRTPAPTVIATPTCTPVPGPCPVAGFLDPPPQHCPASPPLQVLTSSGGGPFYGQSPVWGGGPVPPGATLHVEDDTPLAWPGDKMIWEVGPNYTQRVTVEVTNLATGERAWWGIGSPNPPESQTLTLDPNTTGPARYHGSPGSGYPVAGWSEYGTVLYILAAGCYTMTAIWPEGSWSRTFAAGR
jgi:hypothetical protein